MVRKLIKKEVYSFTFRFKMDGKQHQKTVRASDVYDAGQALKKLYPKATNLKLI